MKTIPSSTLLHRLASVLAMLVALPVVALAPALLVSLILIDQTVDVDESTEQATTIDITDIDPEGTVMYTIRSPMGHSTPPNNDIPNPHSFLADADLIIVSIQDDDGPSSRLDQDSEDGCTFTLHISSDDSFDDQTDTFTGFIRITEDDFFAHSDREKLENCDLYSIYATD